MRIRRVLRLVVLSLALPLVAGSAGFGQTVLTLEDLTNMQGKNVAKGSNTTPSGQLGIKSYHIEELTLTAPVLVDGQTINAAKAWRVSVTGGPFEVRSQAAVISVNGTDLRASIESKDLAEVSGITFDGSIIADGATITLSYGEERNDVPEKVKRNAP